MQNNYNEAISFVFKYEGGYVNNSQDPGGPTNRGITLATARAFWKHDASAEDVKAMPKAVAEGIYRKQYADKINFDGLPSGLDLCALDAAIMSGPSRANTWLKKAKTIEEYQALRLAFYQSLKIWPTFGKGWTNRLNAGSLLANKLKNNLTVSPPEEVGRRPADEGAKEAPKVSAQTKTAGGLVATGGLVASVAPYHYLPYVLGGTALIVVAGYILIKYWQYRRAKVK